MHDMHDLCTSLCVCARVPFVLWTVYEYICMFYLWFRSPYDPSAFPMAPWLLLHILLYIHSYSCIPIHKYMHIYAYISLRIYASLVVWVSVSSVCFSDGSLAGATSSTIHIYIYIFLYTYTYVYIYVHDIQVYIGLTQAWLVVWVSVLTRYIYIYIHAYIYVYMYI